MSHIHQILLSLLVMISFFRPDESMALSEKLKQSLDWEFNANSANKPKLRGKQDFRLFHYEVPMELLSLSFDIDLSDNLRKSLMFEKIVNGEKKVFVRWIINPEDTKYHVKISEFLEKHGYDHTPKEYFIGHLTASRSIYVEDPKTGAVFSGKVSTDRTGGQWQDKVLNKEDVLASMHSAKLAKKIIDSGHAQFKTLKLLQEPTAFYIHSKSGFLSFPTKQGFVIRDIAPLNNDNYYLPGFSAMHEEVGRNIAELNGSHDPVEFWQKHYAEPLGKAMAELSGYFGMALTSAHNQQYLIELDKNFKPTGKIVLRDFSDSHMFAPFFRKSEDLDDQEMKKFYRRKDNMLIHFGLFHGTAAPSWVGKEDVKTLARSFFNGFEERFAEITKIPMEELKKKKPTINQPPSYSVKAYDPNKAESPQAIAAWTAYIRIGACLRGAEKLKDGTSCKELLQSFDIKLPVKEKAGFFSFLFGRGDQKCQK